MGRWEGRYTAGRNPETGKVIYKNVLGKTQAEVKAKLKAAIEESANLDMLKAEQYTTGQWMDGPQLSEIYHLKPAAFSL